MPSGFTNNLHLRVVFFAKTLREVTVPDENKISVEPLKFLHYENRLFLHSYVRIKKTIKASERFVVKCSNASQIEAHKDCMEHHEKERIVPEPCQPAGNKLYQQGSTVRGRYTDYPANSLKSKLCLRNAFSQSSEQPKTQQADITITQKLKDGCKAVGLLLLDHLIITGEGYMSFADEGLL